MSGDQPRGRGGGRGGGGGGHRGGSRGGRGDSANRGRGSGGGPPGPGQSTQMTARGPPPGRGDIYLSGQNVPQPDSEIKNKEDALVLNTKGKTIDGFPGRRGFGTKGRPIILRTNYFKLTTAFEANQPEKTLYKYEIDVTPQLIKPKKRRLVAQMMQDRRFNGKTCATDYGTMIVTTEKLDLGPGQNWIQKVVVPPEDGENGQNQNGDAPVFVQQARARNTVSFKVTYQRSYSLQELIKYLRALSEGAEFEGKDHLIQLLNIIVCKPPNGLDTVAKVGQNKFFPRHGHPGMQMEPLGAGLQALRGYFSSVRPSIGRLLVNINVVSGAFYEPIPLIDLMRKFGGDNNAKEIFLDGLKVKTSYIKDNQTRPFMTKTRTIAGFAKVPVRYGSANEVKFMSNGVQVSVAEHFKKAHGITLKRPDLPVLNYSKQDPKYIPPEICTVMPGNPYKKLLPGEQTAEMIKFAARYPNLNAMSIAGTAASPGNGLRLFRLADPGSDPQPNEVQKFGIRVGTDMITVPGRILDSPQIRYGPNGEKVLHVNNGSWNLQSVKFTKGGAFKRMQVVIINHKGRNGNALVRNPQGDMLAPEALFDRLVTSLRNYGINTGTRLKTREITLEELTFNNRRTNDRALEKLFHDAKDAVDQGRPANPDIFLVVLPAYERWLYARIKFYGDFQFGIHTVNAIGRNLQKTQGQGMFMGNLALKFNVKGGGVSHYVPSTLMSPVGNNTMLFGIDVTHPSPGSTKGAPSIACVVANYDRHLFQWPGSITTQTGGVEMVLKLKEMVLDRLRLWRKKNNTLPDKVVIYRDGVSEGQFKLVLQRELPFFHAAFQEMYGSEDRWPKTAIIICGKRHHTRFYPTDKKDADYNEQRNKGSWNPLPGTVVDRGIVNRVYHEFYLQAHQGLQGTAKPCHYTVIKDDIGFTADQLERFTLNLCYHFVRCTKAVSLCPPAYYADLLAERGRAYLFSTLQENHGSDTSTFDGGSAEWTGGVHADLEESTWYI